MSLDAEIIVAGAGPAGSVAAALLARKGHDVLLIDCHTFPRQKSCGDVIAPSALKILYEMGLEETVQDSGFYPVHTARIAAPGGRFLTLDFKSTDPNQDPIIAPRVRFDALLFHAALESGAMFLNARVLSPVLSDGWVTGVKIREGNRERKLHGRLIIGADGSNSVIAKNLDPARKWNNRIAVAVRAYAEDFETIPHTIEAMLSADFWPGYGWIFPTGPHSANIGLGLRLDRLRNPDRSLKKRLLDFIYSPPIFSRFRDGVRIHDLSGSILSPGSAVRKRRAFDGAILIGDAASLVNPLSGGGIANGILSARIAAGVIHQALANKDVSRNRLRAYEKEIHKAVRGEFLLGALAQKLCYSSTRRMDWALTRLPGSPLFRFLLKNNYPDMQIHIQ